MTDSSAFPPPPPTRKRSASRTELPSTELGSAKAMATKGDKNLNPVPGKATPSLVRAPFPVILDGEEEDEEEESSLVHRSRRRRMNPVDSSPGPHAEATPSEGAPESDRQDQTGFGPGTSTPNFIPAETSR